MKGFSLIFVALLVIFISSTKSSETPVEKEEKFALVHCNETSIFENDEEQAGFPGVKYTWSLNGKPVQEIEALKDRATVSGFGDLLISRFTNRDYGVYTCEVDVNTSGIRVVDVVKKNVDGKYTIPDSPCSLRSCIAASKCQTAGLPNTCSSNGEICCSDIKENDKHRCDHFLGECMQYCNEEVLETRADDCENGEKCCVLLATSR